MSQEYEIHNLLGQGGFANVYRAKCLRSSLDVAIKMVCPLILTYRILGRLTYYFNFVAACESSTSPLERGSMQTQIFFLVLSSAASCISEAKFTTYVVTDALDPQNLSEDSSVYNLQLMNMQKT